VKYYIATSLQNVDAHNKLRDYLNQMGHEITYDWTHHGPVFQEGLDRLREVAELEGRGVSEAEIVIALWPGGRGTHVELGMAIALEKRVLLFSDKNEHHQACPETCAFYHHPRVTMFRDIDHLIGHFCLVW
jgi:nucleoside 2-deoxyribosyltransferase